MDIIKITPHTKETFYYRVMIGISILLCIPAIIFIPYVLILGVFILFSTGMFIGYIKGNGVKVSNQQFPELNKIIAKQSKLLGVKNVPKTYILESGGILNAMETKFVGSNYLILYSDLYEVMLDGRQDVVEFIIAHELCHVKRNHVVKVMYVFPSLVVPFLYQAYSRACEYTCDQVGYSISPKGAVDGIKMLAAGKRLYKNVKTKVFADQLKNEEPSFWVWLSEKLSTHPHLSKRITKEMLKTTTTKKQYSLNRSSDMSNTISEKEKEEEEKEEIPNSESKDYSKYMPK